MGNLAQRRLAAASRIMEGYVQSDGMRIIPKALLLRRMWLP